MLDDLSFVYLQKIAKFYNLKHVNRIKKKNTLIKNLRVHLSIVRIQKWLRKKIAYNERCPISLEYIRYPCWGYKLNNKFVYYNLPDLAYYFVTSGDFRDPSTRNKIIVNDILQISNIIKQFPSMKKIKILKAFKSEEQFILKRQLDEQRDVLDDTIRTVVKEIIDDLITIESNIDRGIDINVHQLLSPKTCEFRICTGILKNICRQSNTNVVQWAINMLKVCLFDSLMVKKLQDSLIIFMQSDR